MGVTKGYYQFTELHKPQVGITFYVDKVFIDRDSKFQNIKIFSNKIYGKVMSLDNMIMLTQKDEFCYHEMLVHVPMFSHKNPQDVLIIGGGDGGTATQVLKHKSVRKVDMVEIDPDVVEASKKHLKFLCQGFKDRRLNLIFTDGIKYVKKTTNKYDIILIDSTDPIGPAIGLFEAIFYKNCFFALKNDGMLCTLSLSPFLDPQIVRKIYANVKKVFKKAFLYWGVVPTYPGAFWSFTLGSKKYHPLKDLRAGDFRKNKLKTKYYNPEIHRSCFSLPAFVEKIIK